MKADRVYKLLGLAYRAGKVIWGYNAVMTALANNELLFLLLAVDSSTRLKAKFSAVCRRKTVQPTIFGDKITIGRALGKPPCAVVGIIDKNFARIIEQRVREVGA